MRVNFLSSAVLLLFLLRDAHAQDLSSLPACAQNPALSSIGSTNCALSDIACICKDTNFINSLNPVVKTQCSPADLASTSFPSCLSQSATLDALCSPLLVGSSNTLLSMLRRPWKSAHLKEPGQSFIYNGKEEEIYADDLAYANAEVQAFTQQLCGSVGVSVGAGVDPASSAPVANSAPASSVPASSPLSPSPTGGSTPAPSSMGSGHSPSSSLQTSVQGPSSTAATAANMPSVTPSTGAAGSPFGNPAAVQAIGAAMFLIVQL